MSSHPSSSTFNPRRILVRGVNWLGDAVMTTPALLRLRERFPEAHIAILTHSKLADLWQHHPALNEVIPILPGEGILALGTRLRPQSFDLVVVLPNSPRSAFEVWAARIPRRLGYRRSWRNWFLTDLVADRPGAVAMHKRSPAEVRRLIAGEVAARNPSAAIGPAAHHVHQYLHLVAALGGNPAPLPPLLRVLDAEVKEAAEKFGLASDATWFALNPGAEYGPAKRWPAERFIAAAQEIQKRTGCRWLVLGGKGDVVLAGSIAARLNGSVNLAGRTSLRELCSVLKLSRVLLTNDTGPMHLGAALGTPVAALFGSTSPELTGPIISDSRNVGTLKGTAPCSPCFLRDCPVDFRCMNSINFERVVDLVVNQFQKNSLVR
jgi:heptosyltransferase-2